MIPNTHKPDKKCLTKQSFFCLQFLFQKVFFFGQAFLSQNMFFEKMIQTFVTKIAHRTFAREPYSHVSLL